MHYYDNVLGLIGRTPLVKLNRITRDIKAVVGKNGESEPASPSKTASVCR